MRQGAWRLGLAVAAAVLTSCTPPQQPIAAKWSARATPPKALHDTPVTSCQATPPAPFADLQVEVVHHASLPDDVVAGHLQRLVDAARQVGIDINVTTWRTTSATAVWTAPARALPKSEDAAVLQQALTTLTWDGLLPYVRTPLVNAQLRVVVLPALASSSSVVARALPEAAGFAMSQQAQSPLWASRPQGALHPLVVLSTTAPDATSLTPLHELGHALGLAHVDDVAHWMHPRAPATCVKPLTTTQRHQVTATLQAWRP